jgi:virginiamycin B lyase
MNTRKLLVSILMLVSVLLSACAPAATPLAPTAVSPTNADAIAGSWSGTAKGGDFNFQITTTISKSCAIGSVCGPFDITAIPCSGEWTLMGISGTTYQMQAGNLKGKCAGNEGGSADSLQLLADGTVLYKCTGGCGEEQGILQRVIAQSTNPQLVEYQLPTSAAHPSGIVAGPDGALWFVETAVNKIGRISTAGVVTEYSVPTTRAIDTDQGFLAVGPDGALWFNEDLVNKIGRITTSGEFTEFALPDEFKPTQEESPIRAIVTGPDDALWVTSSSANAIVKLTMDGKIAVKYVLPKAKSHPTGLVVGPDDALWFVESAANQIGRITLDGKLSEYALPDNNSRALRITVGPDKAMWFTMISANKIGRINTDGEITTFDAAGMGPVGITSGADGALWFTGYGSTEIGRMTTDGILTKIQVPTTGSVPYHITVGPDGNLWFTEQQGNKIGQIILSAP